MQTTQEVKMTIIRAALKMRVLRAVSLRHDVSMVRPTDEQGANHDSDVNAEGRAMYRYCHVGVRFSYRS